MDDSHCGSNSFSPPSPYCDTNKVPEPETWALLGFALALLVVFFWYKKKR